MIRQIARISLTVVLGVAAMARGQAVAPGRPEIGVYYFPNYHPGDARNTQLKGAEWSEWELVKNAKPRFSGHAQPKVPLWGYADESDPEVMAQKIDAAADHGIDAFIFDWYYYSDGPFLEKAVDDGYLKATNRARLKFALMWANHDWSDIHPYARGTPQRLLYSGKVSPEAFDRICDHIVKDYFSQPTYWTIDGKPYFSFYELSKLLDNFGSVSATRAALDRFRVKAKAAGLAGIHLNAVVWGQPILPGENKPLDAPQLIKDLGFDSVTSYVWIHHVQLLEMQTDYNVARDAYNAYWTKATIAFDVPYFPNVSMGWDPSPRARQLDAYGNFGYPFTNTITGNTPARFKEALIIASDRLRRRPYACGHSVLTINSWNEWTEGSYIEPDTRYGMQYLEAIRDVFGVHK
jgi:Glycosyltransferase WbsX